MDDYFVLQSQTELAEGQGSYSLPGFRSIINEPLGMLEPTAVSAITASKASSRDYRRMPLETSSSRLISPPAQSRDQSLSLAWSE